MKKSLIALAVAGTFAAPAFAATSNVDVYGTLRYSVDHASRKGDNNDGWKINDQTSRFGLKGSEDLGGGMKAVYQIEQQINATNGPLDNYSHNDGVTAGTTPVDSAFGGAGLRNTFVGLAGGFGTVIIGRHDTPYKLGGSADLFADTSADSQKNGSGIIGRNGFDNRVSGTIAYVSPDWSGFHFAAATVPGEENVGKAGAVAGATNDAHNLMDAYSIVAVYANGPLKATLAQESFGKKLAGTTSNASATKFNIAYKIGDIGLGYTFERSSDLLNGGTGDKDSAHLASVSYTMGPIVLAGQYGKFNNKGVDTAGTTAWNGSTQYSNTDMSRWTVGATYNLSKRTNAYIAYNSDNFKAAAAEDIQVWTMGVNHSF